MLLKNLVIYRLGANWDIDAEAFDQKLKQQRLMPCGAFDMESRGWVPPRDDDRMLYTQNKHWLLTLGVEDKLLPTSVIKQLAKDRAVDIEIAQGRPVGRKQMRDIREQVSNELMPRALSRRSTTRCWIDTINRWLVVDASADKSAEEFLEALRRVEDDFPCKRLETERSPGGAMTRWLNEGDAPGHFSIDQDLELLAGDASKATVRYARHPLDGKDIKDHIAAGKMATKLGLTWKDRMSFVLTDQMHVKRINYLDIVNDESNDEPDDAEEKFEIDFALMTGEFSAMLNDLVEALEGEKAPRD